jgi:hypothetical protein
MGPNFFEPDLFSWRQPFAEHFNELRAEVQRELEFIKNPVYPAYTEAIADANGGPASWLGRSFVFFTIQNPFILDGMPRTAALLKDVPGLVTASLSRLDGNTHIKPHGGYTPDVLRCHLGIIVPEPEACVLRVGDEERHWAEREWLVFDDFQWHEVWHRGTAPRTVLLIDVVRPGLALSARQVAERFFADGPIRTPLDPPTENRFDHDLESIATRERWREWVEAGQFEI